MTDGLGQLNFYGWTDGGLNGRLENNSTNKWTDGEFNDQHENNSPYDRESNGRHENNSPMGWTVQK